MMMTMMMTAFFSSARAHQKEDVNARLLDGGGRQGRRVMIPCPKLPSSLPEKGRLDGGIGREKGSGDPVTRDH